MGTSGSEENTPVNGQAKSSPTSTKKLPQNRTSTAAKSSARGWFRGPTPYTSTPEASVGLTTDAPSATIRGWLGRSTSTSVLSSGPTAGTPSATTRGGWFARSTITPVVIHDRPRPRVPSRFSGGFFSTVMFFILSFLQRQIDKVRVIKAQTISRLLKLAHILRMFSYDAYAEFLGICKVAISVPVTVYIGVMRVARYIVEQRILFFKIRTILTASGFVLLGLLSIDVIDWLTGSTQVSDAVLEYVGGLLMRIVNIGCEVINMHISLLSYLVFMVSDLFNKIVTVVRSREAWRYLLFFLSFLGIYIVADILVVSFENY